MRGVNVHQARLLLGAATLALAAILAAPQATFAQGVNAIPSVYQGDPTIDRSVPGTDLIRLRPSRQTAIIDWTPIEDASGRAKTFLPRGNTLIFQYDIGGASSKAFSVLNRILPSTNGDVAVIDGNVISRVRFNNGLTARGGTIGFYSPNGLLIGNSAMFDVSQLVLTTLDPGFQWNSLVDESALVQFFTPSQTAGVVIASGARIYARNENSYFLVIAPRIAMNGTAYVNGTTAYLAGDNVIVRKYSNPAKFSFEIYGNSAETAIIHTGSTGGPASTGAVDLHQIIFGVRGGNEYGATMLLSGNLGFDKATSASIDNGEIVLSAGYDRPTEAIGYSRAYRFPQIGSIRIVDKFTATSNILAFSNGWFTANSKNGDINLLDGIEVYGERGIGLFAKNGHDISIAGDAIFHAVGIRTVDNDVFGGTIRADAWSNGSLSISGDYIADATPILSDGNSTGGTALMLAVGGGTINVGGDVLLYANPNSASATSTVSGGHSLGGTARMAGYGGGAFNIGGNVILDSSAFGAVASGRSATGGLSEVFLRDAALTARSLSMYANAETADAIASGGNVTVEAENGSTATVRNVVLDAGAVATGSGTADGGTASLISRSASLIDIQNLTVDVSGTTGDGTYDEVEDGGTIAVGSSNVPSAASGDIE